MKYEKIVEGKFVSRPNRFIAKVLIENNEERVHVKNTGRCKELLVPGAKVYLEDFKGRMGSRKMRYSLVAVAKEREGDNLLINMDSQAPNKVVHEGLISGKITLDGLGKLKVIKPEKQFGDSRFDFYVEDEDGRGGFIEVKGVTLEENNIACFPDAPTTRGVKHVEHLCIAKEKGYQAMILFVIQMKGMKEFRPNDITHPEFGEALRNATGRGVEIKAIDCLAREDSLEIDQEIDVFV